MTDGSRWYFPVYEGLFAAKHVAQMGPAIWLYGWILSRAHVAQNGGAIRYNHLEAAEELGKDSRQVRRWFSTLQGYRYITTRARQPYYLEIEVANWRTVEGWLNTRNASGVGAVPDRTKTSALAGEIGQICPDRTPDRTLDRTKTSALTISIRLLGYQTLSGRETQRAEPETLAQAFQGWLDVLRAGPNKPVMLQSLYALCFGGELPEYGYLGKVARAVGGAGRLAEIMWQLTAKPPTGDVMAYIVAMNRGYKADTRRNGHKQVLTDISEELIELNRIQGVK